MQHEMNDILHYDPLHFLKDYNFWYLLDTCIFEYLYKLNASFHLKASQSLSLDKYIALCVLATGWVF